MCGHPSCLACAIRDTSFHRISIPWVTAQPIVWSATCTPVGCPYCIQGSPPLKTPSFPIPLRLDASTCFSFAFLFLPCAETSPCAQSRCVFPPNPYTSGFLLHCSLSASYTAVLSPSRRAALLFIARLPFYSLDTSFADQTILNAALCSLHPSHPTHISVPRCARAVPFGGCNWVGLWQGRKER